MTDVYHIIEPLPGWDRAAREVHKRGLIEKIDETIKRNLKNGKIHFAAGIFGLGFGAIARNAFGGAIGNAIVINLASALTVTGFSELEHTLLDRIDQRCPKPPPGPPVDPH